MTKRQERLKNLMKDRITMTVITFVLMTTVVVLVPTVKASPNATDTEVLKILQQTKEKALDKCMNAAIANVTLTETLMCTNLLTNEYNQMKIEEQQAQQAQQEAKEYADCLKTEQDAGWCDFLYGKTNTTTTITEGELIKELGSMLGFGGNVRQEVDPLESLSNTLGLEDNDNKTFFKKATDK